MTSSAKKKLGLWVSPLIMLTAAGTAMADIDFCFAPYAGVDAQIRHLDFKKNFGGNALKKNYPQGNFFAGFKFHEYVGLEFGYTVSEKKTAHVRHDNADIVFGAPLAQPRPLIPSVGSSSHSSAKIKGWNANVVGFFPILCEDDSLQLLGSIGVAQLKVKIKHTLTTTFNAIDGTQDIDIIDTDLLNSTPNKKFHKKYKPLLRISGGIQNMLTNCIGVRALVTWENTAKLKTAGRDVASGVTTLTMIKPKSSVNYGLGIFWSF